MFCVFGLYGRFRRQGNLEYEVRVLKGGRPPHPCKPIPIPIPCLRRGGTMVHYVFWLFSGGAPASQPAKGGGGGGFPKPPSHPAAARRSSPDTIPPMLLLEYHTANTIARDTKAETCRAYLHAGSYVGTCNKHASHKMYIWSGYCYISSMVFTTDFFSWPMETTIAST